MDDGQQSKNIVKHCCANERRQCSSCDQQPGIGEFPKKGKGRRENQCRDCYNKRRRSKYSRKNSSFDIESLPIEMEFVEQNEEVDFVPVLLGILHEFSHLKSPETEISDVNVDEILASQSSIEELLS